MPVLACALDLEVRIPGSDSLKSKRSVVRHLLDGARSRFRVASAEVGFQDQWQRAELGFATVSGSAATAEAVLDAVERFVWSDPEVEVISASRHWVDTQR